MGLSLLTKFDASKIKLTDRCAHCCSRIWYPDDYELDEKIYAAPPEFKEKFVEAMGKYNLGSYRLRRCEVCGRTMAAFFTASGPLSGKVYVLYACTLTSEPKDLEVCELRKNCYNCPVKGKGPGGI